MQPLGYSWFSESAALQECDSTRGKPGGGRMSRIVSYNAVPSGNQKKRVSPRCSLKKLRRGTSRSLILHQTGTGEIGRSAMDAVHQGIDDLGTERVGEAQLSGVVARESRG